MPSSSSSGNELNGSRKEDTEFDDRIELSEVPRALKKAEKLFEEKSFGAAVDLLSTILVTLSEKYGEGAPECADALFYYGRALYFNVIETSGILGSNALKYGLDMSVVEDPNKEEVSEYSYYKGQRKFIDVSQDCESNGSSSDGQIYNPDDDLNLAYDILYLALKAYEGRENIDNRLGDVHLYLGHVHLEHERPKEAAESFKNALELKSNIFPPEHRELSELHYIYGVALQVSGDYDGAMREVNITRKNMQKQLEALEARLEVDKSEEDKIKVEIEQIKEGLTDIDSKIDDLNYTIEFSKNGKYEKLLNLYKPADRKASEKAGAFSTKYVSPSEINCISNLIKTKPTTQSAAGTASTSKDSTPASTLKDGTSTSKLKRSTSPPPAEEQRETKKLREEQHKTVVT